MAMNHIRAKARRHGWQQSDDSAWEKFNPFSRRPTRTRTLDAEQQIQQPTETPRANGEKVHQTNRPTSADDTPYTEDQDNIEDGSIRNRAQAKVSEENEPSEDTLDEEEERKRKHDELMKRKIPFGQQVRGVLFPHWYTINWMLIAVPVGIAVNYVHVDPLAVFIVNFLAIVPLAGILSFATEEIALRVGEVLGGLLNASFGNAVELIVGIIALVHKEIVIVQTSLIGSMLSNLLLVLGMCFFCGGVNRVEQFFNTTVAQTAASLLALSVGSLIIPTAYTWGTGGLNLQTTRKDESLSYGTSIIMLLVYLSYLIFQLKSHKEMYNAPSQKAGKRNTSKRSKGDVLKAMARTGGVASASSGGHVQKDRQVVVDEDEPEEPTLSLIGALVTLVIATAFIGLCAEFMVDSINEVTTKYHVSDYFVGLILLPIVGNAAEHATAVTVAIKDKMDLSIGVAVGSSTQIALLVLPLMVILGWIIGADMTLVFDNFQIAVLFVSVILVNYLIADGKSHWLEGILLMSLYIIIAVAAWFYPKSQDGHLQE